MEVLCVSLSMSTPLLHKESETNCFCRAWLSRVETDRIVSNSGENLIYLDDDLVIYFFFTYVRMIDISNNIMMF